MAIEIHGSHQSVTGFKLPPLSCDCHTHVFGPDDQYPYWPGRGYTPPDATVVDMRRLHTHLGLARVVIVHPSPYGTDNRVSIDAAAIIGPSARVIAVVDPETVTGDALDDMNKRSVVGVRLNFKSTGVANIEVQRRALKKAAERCAPLDWHIQLFASAPQLAALAGDIATCPVPVVADHFGLPDVSAGVRDPSFQALLALVEAKRLSVKLSAGYRVTRAAGWSDLDPFARALIQANPDGVVWGSDWPHPGDHAPGTPAEAIVPFQRVDNGHALRCLARWCENDAGILHRILVTTPARLYHFDQPPTNSEHA